MKISFKTLTQFITLSFGSFFSLFINIITLLFFSRIYSNSNFGDYAIFVSVANISSIIITFRLEHMIVLKKTNIEAALLSKTSMKIATYFCLFLFPFLLLFYILSIPFFDQSSVTWLLLLIPIYCLSNNNILIAWNNKVKNYKLISNSKIIQSLVLSFTGITTSFFLKEFGLIISYVTSLVFCFLLFSYNYKKSIKKHKLSTINKDDIKKTILNNMSYIKKSLGLDFFNTISRHLPNFILSSYYGNEIVGIYDMTLKVLNIPKNIISLNIGELYYQKASIFFYKKKEKFLKLTNQTHLILFFIGVLCYLPFVFYGKELFVFSLGEEWSLSGEISEYIAIWMMLLFMSSPMAYVFYIRSTLTKLFLFVFWSFIIKTAVLFYLSITLNEINTLFLYTLISIALEIILNLVIITQNKFS